MGKEEIAHNEQFLLFPQCFLLNQKFVSPFLNIFDIISLFAAEFKKPKIGVSGKGLRTVENLVGKGENADYQHFLLLPKYIYIFFPIRFLCQGH